MDETLFFLTYLGFAVLEVDGLLGVPKNALGGIR